MDESFVFEKEVLFESDRTESQWMESQAEDAVWNDFIHYQVPTNFFLAGETDSSDETIDTEALEKQLNRLFSDQSFFDEKMETVIENSNVIQQKFRRLGR